MDNIEEYMILYIIFSILILCSIWLWEEIKALKLNDKVNDKQFAELSGQIVELKEIGRAHV